MVRNPPCPPNCPLRRAGCQPKCPDYIEYRAALDEDKRIVQEGKMKTRRWTAARKKAFENRQKFEKKLARGAVHK